MDLDFFETPATSHFDNAYEQDKENKPNLLNLNLAPPKKEHQEKKNFDFTDFTDWNTEQELKKKEQIDDDKKTLNIIQENGKAQVISIYEENSTDDIIIALSCVCESLQQGGFILTDMNNNEINTNDYHKLRNNGYYKIVENKTNQIFNEEEYFRKVRVQVEVSKHMEFQQALEYALEGESLIKVTTSGKYHFRYFQITGDQKNLEWYTQTKLSEKCTIPIKNITELREDQSSTGFLQLNISYPFSFSIIYTVDHFLFKERILNVMCKNEREYDLWLCALKGLVCKEQNKLISKNVLLAHSRIYNKNIKENRCGTCTEFLMDKNFQFDSVTVEKCIHAFTNEIDCSSKLSIEDLLHDIKKKLDKEYNNAQNFGNQNFNLEKILEYQEMMLDEDQNYTMKAIHILYEKSGVLVRKIENILENFDQKETFDIMQSLWYLQINLSALENMVYRSKNPNESISKTERFLTENFNWVYKELFTKNE